MLPVEGEHRVAVGGVDQEERGPVADVVAEKLSRLVAVRRAAGRVQQRDVVGVGALGVRGPGERAEADGKDRRAQRVLERLAGAEIGRERQHRHQLGRAHRLLDRPLHLGRSLTAASRA